MSETHFVLVHGLAGKPSPETLKRRYVKYLNENLEREVSEGRIHLAYWADLMGYEALTPEEDEYEEGGDNFSGYSWWEKAKFAAKGFARSQVVGAVESQLNASLEKPDDHESAVGRIFGRIPSLLAGRPAKRIYGRFLPDLHRYFFGGLRDTVQERVRQAVHSVPAGAQVCLIGHSMGSIVAMDLILTDEIQVSTLITIGSPLGLQVVKEQIGVNTETGERLTTLIGTWFNLYDRLDVVALDSDLADDYEPRVVEDIRIRNECVTKEGDRNHHKSYGYLRSPEMTEIIAELV